MSIKRGLMREVFSETVEAINRCFNLNAYIHGNIRVNGSQTIALAMSGWCSIYSAARLIKPLIPAALVYHTVHWAQRTPDSQTRKHWNISVNREMQQKGNASIWSGTMTVRLSWLVTTPWVKVSWRDVHNPLYVTRQTSFLIKVW